MSTQSEPVMSSVLWKIGAMRKIESREVEGFNIVTELNVLISQEQPFNVTAFKSYYLYCNMSLTKRQKLTQSASVKLKCFLYLSRRTVGIFLVVFFFYLSFVPGTNGNAQVLNPRWSEVHSRLRARTKESCSCLHSGQLPIPLDVLAPACRGSNNAVFLWFRAAGGSHEGLQNNPAGSLPPCTSSVALLQKSSSKSGSTVLQSIGGGGQSSCFCCLWILCVNTRREWKHRLPPHVINKRLNSLCPGDCRAAWPCEIWMLLWLKEVYNPILKESSFLWKA